MSKQYEEEREIFSLPRGENKNKKKTSFKVKIVDFLIQCFRGKQYVEVYEEEDAFPPQQEEYFETINLKESDI